MELPLWRLEYIVRRVADAEEEKREKAAANIEIVQAGRFPSNDIRDRRSGDKPPDAAQKQDGPPNTSLKERE